MQKSLPNTDILNLGDLQMLVARSLCQIIHEYGDDAVKVLGLKMISAGGNNRVAIELLHSQYQKYGR